MTADRHRVIVGDEPGPDGLARQHYALGRQALLEECEAVARALYRWQVLEVAVDEARIEAIYRPWFGAARRLRIEVVDKDPGGGDQGPRAVHIEAWSARESGGPKQQLRTIRQYQRSLDIAVLARLERREPGV